MVLDRSHIKIFAATVILLLFGGLAHSSIVTVAQPDIIVDNFSEAMTTWPAGVKVYAKDTTTLYILVNNSYQSLSGSGDITSVTGGAGISAAAQSGDVLVALLPVATGAYTISGASLTVINTNDTILVLRNSNVGNNNPGIQFLEGDGTVLGYFRASNVTPLNGYYQLFLWQNEVGITVMTLSTTTSGGRLTLNSVEVASMTTTGTSVDINGLTWVFPSSAPASGNVQLKYSVSGNVVTFFSASDDTTAGGGDNLGSHLATKALNMGGSGIVNIGGSSTSFSADGSLSLAGNLKTTGTLSGILPGGDTSFVNIGPSAQQSGAFNTSSGTAGNFTTTNATYTTSLYGPNGPVLAQRSTETLVNKNLDTTVSTNTNTYREFSYIYLTHPHNTGGVAYFSTGVPSYVYFGQCTFSNNTSSQSNYCEWRIPVPPDIDLSQNITLATGGVRLTGADVSSQTYILSMSSFGWSQSSSGTAVSNGITLTIVNDGSGADGDYEPFNGLPVTLTSWNSIIAQGQTWVIQLARDGDAATDVSTKDSFSQPIVLRYVARHTSLQ